MAKKREQEGYTYQQEKGFEVARDIANNEAKGQFTNLGVGLGTMAGLGVGMSKIVGGAMNETVNSTNPNMQVLFKLWCSSSNSSNEV